MTPLQFTAREKQFVLMLLMVFLAGFVYRHVREERAVAAMRAWQHGQESGLQQFIAATRGRPGQPVNSQHKEKPDQTGSLSREKAQLVGRLDINTATAEELQTLERIGPVLAARIIALREERGGFRTIEELLLVKGIGNKTLARIEGEVCVRCDNEVESGKGLRPPRQNR